MALAGGTATDVLAIMTALRKQGHATVPAALMEAMTTRLGLSATALADEDVILALGACARTGYIADPHTGTGLAALLRTGTLIFVS